MKKLTALIIALTMIFSLAACKSANDNAVTEPTKAVTENTVTNAGTENDTQKTDEGAKEDASTAEENKSEENSSEAEDKESEEKPEAGGIAEGDSENPDAATEDSEREDTDIDLPEENPLDEQEALGSLLTASVKNNRVITYFDELNKPKAELFYDSIKLSDEYCTLYAGLDAMLQEYNFNEAAIISGLAGYYNEQVTEAEGEDEYFQPYLMNHTVDIKRADANVFSFVKHEEAYTSVGGYSYCYGYNFDSASGRALTLDDICDDRESLAVMLAERFFVKYTEIGLMSEEDLVTAVKELIDIGRLSFTIGYQGVEFYLDSSFISVPSHYTYSVLIPFGTEYGPEGIGFAVLKDAAYSNVSENYMISLSNTAELDYYLSNDSEIPVNIEILGMGPDVYGGYSALYIMFNGEPEVQYEYGEDFRTYLVRSNGATYLYVEKLMDSDDTSTDIYKLTDAGLKKVKYSTNICGLEGFGEGRRIVCSPEAVKFYSRSDVLGTTFESAIYRIGEKGTPENLGRYLDIKGDIELTLKQPFKTAAIDSEIQFAEDSNIDGALDYQIELEKADKIVIKKTDGEHQIFFVTADGEWGVFEVNSFKVGSVGVLDLFDNVPMAD